MCPRTTIYVSSYYPFMRPHTAICVLMRLYMCPILLLHFTPAIYYTFILLLNLTTDRCRGGGERCSSVACICVLMRLYMFTILLLHFTTAIYYFILAYRSVPRRRRALLISGLLLQTKLIALSARLLYSASAHLLLQVRHC